MITSQSKIYTFIFNIWNLLLLWFIGGIYIPKEYLSRKVFKCTSTSKLKLSAINKAGKVAIITGGSRGIGLVVVKSLLKLGVHAIIGSSAEQFKREHLKKELENEVKGSKVDIWYLDLKSMKSVKEFASKFRELHLPLHYVINNAGIMFVPYEETLDKFESHFSVNFLGHCLLSNLLLPLLRANASEASHSRIINVTSCVAALAKIHFDDLQGSAHYSAYNAYSQSKLAQLMYTMALQRKFDQEGSKINVFCVHPGVVDTGLHNNVWWAPNFINKLYKTPEEGSETILVALLAEELEGQGGAYLEDCRVSEPFLSSKKQATQEKLFSLTQELLQPWFQ